MAKNLAQSLELVRVSADRIRSELFANPRFDAQENAIVGHIMNYMTEEFLNNGVSVIYDTNAVRVNQRRALRDLARRCNAHYMLLWMQADAETAYTRTQKRDRRTTEDKFAQPHNQLSFEKFIGIMQNPQDEDYLVLSGKHAFITQKGTVVNRLYKMGLISSDTVQANVAKPELVNLVPNPSDERVDTSSRNISVS